MARGKNMTIKAVSKQQRGCYPLFLSPLGGRNFALSNA
jgi:hypothetical protein